MSVCAQVPVHGDLNAMLYLYDLYHGIFVYVIKSHGQTSSPSSVETQERCIPNLTEAYSGHEEEEMDLRLSNDAANVGTTRITILTACCPPISW